MTFAASLEYQLANPLPLETISLLSGYSLVDVSIEWEPHLVRGEN